jgi:hypothetical protein
MGKFLNDIEIEEEGQTQKINKINNVPKVLKSKSIKKQKEKNKSQNERMELENNSKKQKIELEKSENKQLNPEEFK